MPSPLTIQPSDQDLFLRQNYPDTNYILNTIIYVYCYTAQISHGILRFDFSALPAGAVISAATLSLYLNSGTADNRTYWIYELTQTEWVEAQATWNIYKTESAWTAPGGDFTTTDGASLTVPSDPNWMDFNVLALVKHFQSEHNKIANFLLKDGTEDGGNYSSYLYNRKSTTDLTLRPKLVITYTMPGLSIPVAMHHYQQAGGL